MEKIELPYLNKEFKIKKNLNWFIQTKYLKMKEIKIKTIQILDISNSLKFWIDPYFHSV